RRLVPLVALAFAELDRVDRLGFHAPSLCRRQEKPKAGGRVGSSGTMQAMRFVAVPLVALAFAPVAFAGGGYHSSVHALSPSVRALVKRTGFWHKGCPVSLSDLRVLTVSRWGFDGHTHNGQIIVNKGAAAPLATAFHRIYRLHFRIRDMSLRDTYSRHEPADP